MAIFNYGMKFQVISFSQLLFDPMTKVLLGHFGGLGMVGYYEMANRLVMQVRGLIVNANQVMVPVVADLNEKDTNSIKSLYKETLSVVILFTVPSMAFLISNTDLISFLWIDAINDTFWLLVSLVSLSMLVNILAGPSYFTFLGIGKLNPLLAAQLIMGVCNLVLGYSFGQLFLGIGVIIGMVFSIIIASIYLIYFFHRSYLVELNSIINKDSIFLFIAFIINFFAVIAIRKYYINQEMLIFTFSFLSFIIVFIPCIIMNNSFRNKILPVFTKKRV
jgi:O-antigen/teichoic acid export membrane protein